MESLIGKTRKTIGQLKLKYYKDPMFLDRTKKSRHLTRQTTSSEQLAQLLSLFHENTHLVAAQTRTIQSPDDSKVKFTVPCFVAKRSPSAFYNYYLASPWKGNRMCRSLIFSFYATFYDSRLHSQKVLADIDAEGTRALEKFTSAARSFGVKYLQFQPKVEGLISVREFL